nr:hypothetical protein [Tanacetum cinerariifolium]
VNLKIVYCGRSFFSGIETIIWTNITGIETVEEVGTGLIVTSLDYQRLAPQYRDVSATDKLTEMIQSWSSS